MEIEQVKAWYEGAELVTDPDFEKSSKFRKPNLSTTYKEWGVWWCHRKNGKAGEILLHKEGKFIAEITKYRELKVGDTIELNGLKGGVATDGEEYFIYAIDNKIHNYKLLGTDTKHEAHAVARRILGYNAEGIFPHCRTLQDLSKLYWVRKYELKYREPQEMCANKEIKISHKEMVKNRELIGYDWKDEEHMNAFTVLTGLSAKGKRYNGLTVDFQKGSACHMRLKEENLLDLWTVPVYRDQEKVFTMGFDGDTFEVVVRDGKAYHGTDDITEFVRGLNEVFNTPTEIGGYSYTLEDKNVIFTSTGCQDKKSSLEQWDKVHDALG